MPEEIIPAGLKELSRFGVGKESNALYFDGQRVQTATMVVLTDKQKWGGFIIALSAAVAATAACVSAYAAVIGSPSEKAEETSTETCSLGARENPAERTQTVVPERGAATDE